MDRLVLRWVAVGAALVTPLAAPIGAHANEPRPAPTSSALGAPQSTGDEADPDDEDDGTLAGPVPFVDDNPLLAELRALLAERTPSKKALAAALPVLEDWLASRASRDPLARATAEWLRARLLTAVGRAEARAAWEDLATTPGAFSDDAREILAALDHKARRPAAAAHWLLTRSPWSPDYLDGVRTAVKDLTRLGQEGRAIELLEQAILQGMSRETRTELVLLLGDLHVAAGQGGRAEDLLAQAFWTTEHPDKRVERALKAMGAAPSADDVLFHQALHASRNEALKFSKQPSRRQGPIVDAAKALLERWDDEAASQALAALPELPPLTKPDAPPKRAQAKAPRGRAPEGAPYLALTRGMLLRKLDRDADAVLAFQHAIAQHPDHPLSQLARDQAATLLRALGRPAEARPLDERLLETALPGELHRAALWRLGFGAILERAPEEAELHLRELERRHGGEPDRHSFCWYERARYWRGRAAELGRDKDLAEAQYRGLVQRFPAGWYALLARTRLGLPTRAAPQPKAADAYDAQGWDVPRDDPMATALALYRLGEEDRAREHFEALLDADQLPGNGRKLLADLLELAGDERQASRVLKYASIPPTMPGDDPDLVYFDWYPLRFEEALGDAAEKNNLPSSLLAGLVSVETRFSADAKSHVGAIGAAQLMKSTGAAIGKKVFGKDFDAKTLSDPDVNLAIAARYLSDLLERFKGHPALAVAAYNAGPAPVKRWLELRGDLELDAFIETIPFEQARRYVMRVLSDAEIYRRLYGLDGRPIALPLSLDRAARR